MTDEPHKRRWFQFRLRTLFILVVVLAVPLAWLAHERSKVRARLDWLESLMLRGTVMEFSNRPPAQPAWLRTLFGDHFPEDVITLGLEEVGSDDDRVHVAGLTQLQTLYLRGDRVTDAWLVDLAGLNQLRELHLTETQVTDAGLSHLHAYKNLQTLRLQDTQVTMTGIQKLQQALPSVKITGPGMPNAEAEPAPTGLYPRR